MTREVETGSHLFVWSGMPNISKMLSETLSQHPARFTYIQFTTFETHNNINYIFRSARKRVFDLGAATGAHNLSGVVDVWAGARRRTGQEKMMLVAVRWNRTRNLLHCRQAL